MRCTLTVVCLLLLSSCCLGQGANNTPTNETPDIAELQTRLEKLEQRVKELESDGNVGPQSEGQGNLQKNSDVHPDWTHPATSPV
ncbi:hypothetical protein K227x_22670 [Rubripirellula lacrimiformis]|uniref:Uncharacterized protein n=1 Tax=Rubripirellula lacrimiformis TaxID=1930273 RepID=A0A517N9S3_9BACT|nr:hypothetical protein K227x_22670 [Rubripirellula lacrimiformis]